MTEETNFELFDAPPDASATGRKRVFTLGMTTAMDNPGKWLLERTCGTLGRASNVALSSKKKGFKAVSRGCDVWICWPQENG